MWIIFYELFLVQSRRQTESDAYEPTVQTAQVGSIKFEKNIVKLWSHPLQSQALLKMFPVSLKHVIVAPALLNLSKFTVNAIYLTKETSI